MNEWVRRALPALCIATGLLFTGAAAAHAAEGNPGVGNGNRVEAPITVPLNVCGNSVGVLGEAKASCERGATADHPEPSPSMSATTTATPPPSPSGSPGGGGAPTPKDELPLTGASVGGLIGLAVLLLVGGVAMIVVARRRVRRGAHAA